MTIDLLYFSMVASFITHELDAVKRHEWRVLPVFRALPETAAEQTFIWAHIPLLGLLIWGSMGAPDSLTRIGLSLFAVIHAGLHVFYRTHPRYEFNNLSSWLLVILTGVLGLAYLIVVSL